MGGLCATTGDCREGDERSAGRRRWRHDLVVPALVVSVREVGKGRA